MTPQRFSATTSTFVMASGHAPQRPFGAVFHQAGERAAVWSQPCTRPHGLGRPASNMDGSHGRSSNAWGYHGDAVASAVAGEADAAMPQRAPVSLQT